MPAHADVLVIGGGSTGCGIARDLARRGVDVVLVERGHLTQGTTGRMHGLLHSGARYADTDPESARACIAENRILRRIAAHCVEPTGGLFVSLSVDDPAYVEEKRAACEACDIPANVLSAADARDRAPYLAPDVEAAIEVPDAAVDPFRLCVANAIDAEAHGARIETHAEVVGVRREAGAVTGVTVRRARGPDDRGRAPNYSQGPVRGELVQYRADVVVNATGAWAGQLAAMAGLELNVRPSKGAMTVMNVRQVDTVVNRCRPKGDADIIVPHETTAILGTTDEEVTDPDTYAERPAAVDRLIDELAALVPILADARSIRSFWGVRPLYEPPDRGTADPTDITRAAHLVDHEDRDGLAGFVSIVGGKFTTYRRMAEETADLVCEQLGVDADSDTAAVPLPGSDDPDRLDDEMDRFGLRSPLARRSRERLGDRTAAVLGDADPNPTVCTCEGVTQAEVRDAVTACGADLNAVRIRTRATMGTCQGAFCAFALANELHPDHDVTTATAALDELLDERWKGERHALWGEHLAQAMLGYAIRGATFDWYGDDEPDWAAFAGGGSDGD